LLSRYDEGYGLKVRAIPDPLDRLLAIVATYFTPVFQSVVDNAAYYACYSLSFHNSRVRMRFQRMYACGLQLLEATISECIAASLIPSGDPRQLARVVYSLEEGYFALSAWDPFGTESVDMSQ